SGRRVGGGTAVRVEEPQLGVPGADAAGAGGPHRLSRLPRRARGEAGSVSPGPEALLVLEDGSAFRGRGFGAAGEAFGEAVFNTGMSGYQEVITDPSYAGQVVTMTSPHQGNYGVNREDPESARIQVAAFAVREASRRASSWRADRTLPEEL